MNLIRMPKKVLRTASTVPTPNAMYSISYRNIFKLTVSNRKIYFVKMKLSGSSPTLLQSVDKLVTPACETFDNKCVALHSKFLLFLSFTHNTVDSIHCVLSV